MSQELCSSMTQLHKAVTRGWPLTRLLGARAALPVRNVPKTFPMTGVQRASKCSSSDSRTIQTDGTLWQAKRARPLCTLQSIHLTILHERANIFSPGFKTKQTRTLGDKHLLSCCSYKWTASESKGRQAYTLVFSQVSCTVHLALQ